jgi:hypothetical protein
MKRFVAAGIAVLAFSAVAKAQILYIPPIHADGGVKAYFRLYWAGTDRCNAGCPGWNGHQTTWGGGPPGYGGPGAGSVGFGAPPGPGYCNGLGCQAGPWYSYWPYEAHFQSPAPQPYPYYPPPQTLPPYPGYTGPQPAPGSGSGSGVPPGSGSAPGSGSGSQTTGPAAFQQSAYYGGQQNVVPSYWYQR